MSSGNGKDTITARPTVHGGPPPPDPPPPDPPSPDPPQPDPPQPDPPPPVPPHPDPPQPDPPHHDRVPIGEPVSVAWREGTQTRVKELDALADLFSVGGRSQRMTEALRGDIDAHLEAARAASRRRRPWRPRLRSYAGASMERAISNLNAAETHILQVAPTEYLLGQMPALLNQVKCHLSSGDPRRQEFERIARQVGLAEHSDHAEVKTTAKERAAVIETERSKIVSIAHGAGSANLREQLQVRSFRNVLVATSVAMAVLAAGIALLGWFSPTSLPLCFQPEQNGQTVVVCPTAQSAEVNIQDQTGPVQPEVDEAVQSTVRDKDVVVVEVLGLLAAAVAAAAALRRMRGSSEPHGLPVALAVLKLPSGAVTAVLGLLLMRGGFVPGLTALDTSAQILAWAILFGYAQQLFTRFVDQQADSVLDNVRNPGTPAVATPA